MTELTKTHLRALSEILDRNERRAPEAAMLRVLQDKLGIVRCARMSTYFDRKLT